MLNKILPELKEAAELNQTVRRKHLNAAAIPASKTVSASELKQTILLKRETMQVYRLSEGLMQLDFFREDVPVNKFDAKTLADLEATLDFLESEEQINGLVVTSSHASGFIVGADITEFLEKFKLPEAELSNWLTYANSLFNRFETLPFPTVTAINRLAYGGGFEFALAADFRVMDIDASVSFPEVKLGLIPGFGGTVRFSRLVALKEAVDGIMRALVYTKNQHLTQRYLMEAIVPGAELYQTALNILADVVADKSWQVCRAQKMAAVKKVDDLYNDHISTLTEKSYKRDIEALNNRLDKIKLQRLAPELAMEAVVSGLFLPRDKALKKEQAAFIKAAKSDQAVTLVQNFFVDQAVKGLARKQTKQVSAGKTQQIGMLGTGRFSASLCATFIDAGHKILHHHFDHLDQKSFDAHLDVEAQEMAVRYGLTTDACTRVLTCINSHDTQTVLAPCDMILEAVPDYLERKKDALDTIALSENDAPIVVTTGYGNTVAELAEFSGNPEKFVGAHFFSRPYIQNIVEVIPGKETAPETTATLVKWLQKLGKTPLITADVPGGVIAQIVWPYLEAFIELITVGASIELVNDTLHQFGFAEGPAIVLDEIGIDRARSVREKLRQAYPEVFKTRGLDLLDKMVEMGELGRKTSRGFYQYSIPGKYIDTRSFDHNIYITHGSLSPNNRTFTESDIVERLLIPMIFAAAKALEAGFFQKPEHLDSVIRQVTALTPIKVGPLYLADQIGLSSLRDKAQKIRDDNAMMGLESGLYEWPTYLQTRLEQNIRFYAV